MAGLRIRSLRDGFRRAGVAHPAAWTEHPAGAFDAGQIAALRAEPMLIVEDAAPQRAPQRAPEKAPAETPAKDALEKAPAKAPPAKVLAKPAPEKSPPEKPAQG